MSACVGAIVGVALVGWGLLVMAGQVSPGPARLGGHRDVVASGAATSALGGGVLASWWLGYAPGSSDGWASVVTVLLFATSLVLHVRAAGRECQREYHDAPRGSSTSA